MVEIIPAVMSKTFAELKKYSKIFDGVVSYVQIDTMDGIFVPDTSWPYVKDGEFDEDFKKIVAQEEKLPKNENLKFEFDLMTDSPENNIKSFVQIGAGRLIFHIESIRDFDWFWKNLAFVRPSLPEFGEEGIEIGLALNIDTSNEEVYKHIEKIDFVQFMGISKIGFQGQSFDERVLQKIIELKTRFPNMIVSVDGSVNMQTAPQLISAGADRLAVGSAILQSHDIKKAIKEFQSL